MCFYVYDFQRHILQKMTTTKKGDQASFCCSKPQGFEMKTRSLDNHFLKVSHLDT